MNFNNNNNNNNNILRFEACARLAQQWLVCAPLGIHPEPI